MVGDETSSVEDRHAGTLHEKRSHHQTRHAESSSRSVTLQALITAVDARLGASSLVHRVEDHALQGIHRCDFDYIAAGYPADKDIVVKVQRARSSGRNTRRLKAGFGIHQHLRRLGYVQRSQHRTQITMAVVVLEPDVALP